MSPAGAQGGGHPSVPRTRRAYVGRVQSSDPAAPAAPAAHDRYRQLFEESAAAQLVVDAGTGRVVEANRAAADFYGVPRAALVDASLSSLGDGDASVLDDALEVAAEIGLHLVGLPQRHASGERRIVEVYGTPLPDAGRAVVHLILHDITDRARAEQREREFLTKLAHQDATQRQATLTRMGELVAGVAHEVRTPLFALSSAIDAMQRRLGENADFERYAPLLRGQVDRLSALMGDLLDYGRPAALVPRDIAVAELLSATVEVSRPALEAATVTLRVRDACPEPTVVRVDRLRWVQALQNLVANAAQHSKAGGEVQLSAALVEGGSWVEFRVEDRGPGFDPAHLDQVFAPFFTRRPGGTGLGLALVHRTVHDHSGLVFAENSLRTDGSIEGARLRVRIPTPT